MEKLKIEKKVVYEIGCNNWDRLVNEFFNLITIKETSYGKETRFEYDIVAIEELSNDSKFEYTPYGQIYDYNENEYLEPLLGGDYVPTYSTRTIMDYFVQVGILDKGKTYQIDVSW